MKQILQTVLAIVIVAIVAALLNKPVRKLLKRFIEGKFCNKLILGILVRVAEKKFKEPGSGVTKKAWVMETYEKWVAAATTTIDQTIDCIVAALNVKKDSLQSSATDKATDIVDNIIDK